MRDDHDRALEAGEERLETREPGEVEVVRRLVEQQHVVAAEQNRRERRPCSLAAREPVERSFELDAEAELGEHGRRARVEVGAATLEVRVERLRVRLSQVGLGREPCGEPVHQRRRSADARPPREIAVERLACQRITLLRQMPDREQRRVAPDRAGVRRVEAAEQPQQRRLAGAVRPDEPDARVRRHDEIDVREDDVCSVRLRDACGGEGAERTQRVNLLTRTSRYTRRESGF